MERYDVMLGREIVGDVKVNIEGLYIRFSCKCKLPDSQIHRLMVRSDGKQMDLGICVPDGDFFVLDRRVQRKHIGEGDLNFCVSPNKPCTNENFIAINPEKPFPYISMLQNANLQKRGESYGILLPKDCLCPVQVCKTTGR